MSSDEQLHRQVHHSLMELGRNHAEVARALERAAVVGRRKSDGWNPITNYLRRKHGMDFETSMEQEKVFIQEFSGHTLATCPMPLPVCELLHWFDMGNYDYLLQTDTHVVKVERDKLKGGTVPIQTGDGRRHEATLSSLLLAVRATDGLPARQRGLDLQNIIEVVPAPGDCPFDPDPQ